MRGQEDLLHGLEGDDLLLGQTEDLLRDQEEDLLLCKQEDRYLQLFERRMRGISNLRILEFMRLD